MDWIDAIKRWEDGDPDLHVIPIDDVRPHVESPHCLCKPWKLNDCEVWVHNAYDGRDRQEQYDRATSLKEEE